MKFFRVSFSLVRKKVLTKLTGTSKMQKQIWNIKVRMPPQQMKLV